VKMTVNEGIRDSAYSASVVPDMSGKLTSVSKISTGSDTRTERAERASLASARQHSWAHRLQHVVSGPRRDPPGVHSWRAEIHLGPKPRSRCRFNAYGDHASAQQAHDLSQDPVRQRSTFTCDPEAWCRP
jgi:hypothetical protein